MAADRIVDAAIELVDEAGLESFSMRALAKRLDSSTATLYRHFSSRDEILVVVVDRVLGEAPRHMKPVSDTARWEERLVAMAEALFLTLKTHPNVVSLLDTHIPLGEHALAAREAAISILVGGGFEQEAAARAYTAFARFVVGFASQLRGAAGAGGVEDEEIRHFYESLDPGRYPSIVASARYFPTRLDEEFRFGLQLFVDGLGVLRASKAATDGLESDAV